MASARAAIAHVLSVLPAECAEPVARDASELLQSLHRHTGRRQFIMHLELVRGDTCQKWARTSPGPQLRSGGNFEDL